jgi:hypothetical protein
MNMETMKTVGWCPRLSMYLLLRLRWWTDPLPHLRRQIKIKKKLEGPKRRTREGEPIIILFKNSAHEPEFTRAPPQASLAKFT